MPVCPSCNREQTQSSAFCMHCGAVLDRPASDALPHTDQTRRAAAERHDFGDIGAYVVRRFLALVVDVVLVPILIAVALHAWLSSRAGGQLTLGAFTQLVIYTGAALFLYRWLFEGIAGATLGKLLFGLGVGRSGGGSAGLVRVFVRTLALPLDLLVIGFFIAALTPKRQRIGDLAGGTVVANSRIGPLAPIIGIVILGATAFGVYYYAGGVNAAQRLANDAYRLGPSLLTQQSPSPSPLPVAPKPSPTASQSPAPPAASPLPTSSAT